MNRCTMIPDRPGFFLLNIMALMLPMTFSLHAQESRHTRHIAWEESRPISIYEDSVITFPGTRYLFFKNAGYPDEASYLPHYNDRIALDASAAVDSVRLENIEYSEITAEEIKDVPGLENLKTEAGFTWSVASQRKEKALWITVLPLRKNPVSGRPEKATAFTIHTFVRSGGSPAEKSPSYAGSSVLSSGKWYKIKIYTDGIYRLTYEDLQKIGFSGIENIRVYGNGGQALPLMNAEPRPDDLQENAVYMEKGTDGIFKGGDYILFFGKGIASWNYSQEDGFFMHTLNGFSDAAYYFLTTDLGAGKRIPTMPQASGAVTHTITAFDDYAYYEKNLYNLIKSGRQWFSDKLSSPVDTTFAFANIVKDNQVRIKVNVASRASSPRSFTISNQDKVLGHIVIDKVDLDAFTGEYAKQKSGFFPMLPASDDINVNVSYGRSEYSDLGWLDYITVNARRNLIMTGNALFFRDISSTGAGNTGRFTISGATENLMVWDVTDPCNAARLESVFSGSALSYTTATDTLREFVALLPGAAFPKPIVEDTDLGWVENQNLHGTASSQMLIVTHPDFLQQAERLAAFRRDHDNMSVLVVTTDQVYNEFSSGAHDVSAVRDFARMLYLQPASPERQLKYLLLFGDGSHNNHMQVSGNSNFILTYQSVASLVINYSYVSDDFYGLMDANEGGSDQMEDFELDLGVGRLPVKDSTQAGQVVAKIMGYNSAINMRDWRSKIMFVADDGDDNKHMRQANNLADMVGETHPQFIIKKLLSDAYKQVSTSTGARYPDVTKAIYDNVHRGILIFNYTGHGNEKGLADEQLVTREQLSKYTNAQHLPLFVTATCEFSRYDDLADDETGKIREQPSAGEVSLLNPDGGCIALLSTSRLVYADNNMILNENFYDFAFQYDDDGKVYRLGDIIRMTKNEPDLHGDGNKLNFTLLGDPALRLAVPFYTVVTDSLNGVPVSEPLDTLKAFTEITVNGHLVDQYNAKLEGFSGILYPSVYDKADTLWTLGNDDTEKNIMPFEVRDNMIYKGKASVNDGEFSFSFRVPKDITYSLGNGKIFYYAQDSVMDANGYFDEFIIGGTSPDPITDETGPVINLFMNDENFVDGGITDTDPIIFARISDENGINTTGNGIGHDIVGIVDGDATQPLILNDFYEADLDDYKNGTVNYPLADLAVGMHTIKMRVWDIFNTPSEAVIGFEVIDEEDIILVNVYNYPNPATNLTYFQFEHNKAGSVLKVTLTVYDLSGRRIRTFEENLYMEGYRSSPLEWDLKDQNGNKLRSGIYPYRIRVEDESGLGTDGFHKLIILN
jgi:hypothetical protein